jgi:protein-S-isoprenylcysteine O-methyltransferase
VITTAVAVGLIVFFMVAIEPRFRGSAEARTWRRTGHDRGSQVAVALAFFGTELVLALATALSLANIGRMPAEPVVGVAGLVAMVAGIGIRYAAVRTLGAYYTRTLRVVPDHRVVDGGPYRFVRHPGYLGMILLLGGAAVATANWVGVLLGPAAVFALYVYRIRAEETMLRRELGRDYVEYARRTSRLIPFVY